MTDSILVIGEALIDIVEQPDGRRVEHVGGSPTNVAVGLSRLGQDPVLLTSFGQDAQGDLIAAHLEAAGVRVAEGSRHDRPTSTAVARLDASGAADYSFEIGWDLPATRLVTPPRAVHTGSIAAFLEPGASRVVEELDRWAPTATICFDPNIRPSLIASRGDALERVEQIVALSDVVKVSDEDLAWLCPGSDPGQQARAWLDLGPAIVFVTLGPEGSLGMSAAGAVDIRPRPVEVVDTVGAGDAFMSGLIDALAREGLLGAVNRDRLRDIGLGALLRIGEHASTVSRLTVARAGAQPPTRAAVLAEEQRLAEG